MGNVPIKGCVRSSSLEPLAAWAIETKQKNIIDFELIAFNIRLDLGELLKPVTSNLAK